VATPDDHEPGVLGGQASQPCEGGDDPGPHEDEGVAHLELLDVLGQVPAGHALVDVLEAGEGGELLDAGLDVVPGDPFPSLDGSEVDVADDLLVGLDGAVGHVDAEVGLRPQHGQPETALEHDPGRRRPQLDQLRAGVPRGQDVRDHPHFP
jgi:hypothetical protein